MSNLENLRPWRKGQSGNPQGVSALMLKYRKALQEAISTGDFTAVVEKLKDAAKKGQPWAVKEFLTRTLGNTYSVDLTTPDMPVRSEAERISDRNLRNYLIRLETSILTLGSTGDSLRASGVKLTDKAIDEWVKKEAKDFDTANPIEDLHLTPRGEERLVYVCEDMKVMALHDEACDKFDLPLPVKKTLVQRYAAIRYPDGLGIFGDNVLPVQEAVRRLQADTEANKALDAAFGKAKSRGKGTKRKEAKGK